MTRRRRAALAVAAPWLLVLAACSSSDGVTNAGATSSAAVSSASASSSTLTSGSGTASGSPPGSGSASSSGSAVGSASASGAGATTNVYAAAGKDMLTGPAATARPMVYVPNTIANTVEEIDPKTYTVVRRFRTGAVPQHVVPSWDLKTLWVNVNSGNTLIPIDPATGEPGKPVAVADPYNLYFTPDGAHALVMAEALRRIDVRDPHTMALQRSLPVPCKGVNHADFTADLSSFVVSCEFSGKLLVIPADASKVTKVIDLNAVKTPGGTSTTAHGGVAHNVDPGVDSMPQDVRLTPDGRTFLAADMLRNGVWEVDAATFTIRRFRPTGMGAHGIYPSRDATRIFVSNRDEGTVSVLDAATLAQTALWKIPGGGSPDMGGVSADGATLWLSGRSHSVVYVFDTTTGAVITKIRTDAGPHGLAVWPQPGRYSLGHTGNMR